MDYDSILECVCQFITQHQADQVFLNAMCFVINGFTQVYRLHRVLLECSIISCTVEGVYCFFFFFYVCTHICTSFVQSCLPLEGTTLALIIDFYTYVLTHHINRSHFLQSLNLV